ncbi:beta-lactamase [Plectosphaerella plurivora]|uniref:Beta-lactamase n=1 Tax=Plectosphaerella plurivora TaxID=936078 RepID=A0A9P8VKD0_9PEZI|nr:beta-lactamase [Plectosphaerella plurivora]
MATVQGHCDPEFQEVRDLFQQFLDSGEDLGAAVAVNIDGRNVIDLWGGYVDEQKAKPWERDTIVNVYSTTKTVTSLAMLRLVDIGLVNVTDKVSQHWPEFAANGKEDIEIRHLLSHSSGLSGWTEKMTPEDVCNLELGKARLAAQAPLWTPGTASGYHGYTFGHVPSEIIKRKTGLGLKEFLAREIAGPLGADFQIGALEKDWPRIATLTQPPPFPAPSSPPDPIAASFFLNPPVVPEAVVFASSPTWRNAEIGASNGHGNARGLVRLFTEVVLAEKGEANHVVSKKTADLVLDEQVRGNDLVLGGPFRFGIGFALVGDGFGYLDTGLPRGRLATWNGYGGSSMIMDFDRHLTFAYTMNKMKIESPHTGVVRAYLAAIYKALGVEIPTQG